MALKKWILLCFCLLPVMILAYEPGQQNNVPSLGQVAHNMMVPMSVVSDIGLKIFYILGAGFLVAAGIRYRGHRANPNHVRMGEVLMLLFLGLLLLLSPLLIEQAQGAKILKNVSEGTL